MVRDHSGDGVWDALGGRPTSERAQALLELVEGLEERGDAQTALQAALAAAEVAAEQLDVEMQARAWLAVGQAYVSLGQQELASRQFERASLLWGDVLRWDMQGQALLAAYDAARAVGKADEAEPMLQEAYVLLVGVDERRASAWAAIRLAERHYGRFASQEASELLEQARSFAGSDCDLVMMANDLQGGCLMEAGAADAAIGLLTQAMDIAESHHGGAFPRYEAWRLARALRLAGRFTEAVALAEHAIARLHADRQVDPDALGSFLLELAVCQSALGSPEAPISLRRAWHHLLIAGNAGVLEDCRREISRSDVDASSWAPDPGTP